MAFSENRNQMNWPVLIALIAMIVGGLFLAGTFGFFDSPPPAVIQPDPALLEAAPAPSPSASLSKSAGQKPPAKPLRDKPAAQ